MSPCRRRDIAAARIESEWIVPFESMAAGRAIHISSCRSNLHHVLEMLVVLAGVRLDRGLHGRVVHSGGAGLSPGQAIPGRRRATGRATRARRRCGSSSSSSLGLNSLCYRVNYHPRSVASSRNSGDGCISHETASLLAIASGVLYHAAGPTDRSDRSILRRRDCRRMPPPAAVYDAPPSSPDRPRPVRKRPACTPSPTAGPPARR